MQSNLMSAGKLETRRPSDAAPLFGRGGDYVTGHLATKLWGFSGLQLVRVVYNINSSASCHAIMKFWTSLFLCFSLLSGALAAQSSPSQDRFEKYQALSRSSPVDLESSSFAELTTAPRDYYAVVLLTALDARYGCVMCREFDPEWNLMARSWNKGSKPDDLKVVFGTLDFDNGKAVFQKVSNLPYTSLIEAIEYEFAWKLTILTSNSSCSKPHPCFSCFLPPLDRSLSWTPSR
jgi:hypothetical protein